MISAANSGERLPGPAASPDRTRRGQSARVAILALLTVYALGCAGRVVEAGSDTAEGEAVLAALEHVAEIMWEPEWRTLVEGRAAIAHDGGETPLPESTRGFLDAAFEARGWRWSTEDPLVPTGDCAFPHGGDCRLKDPTELHLTFTVRPWPGEEDYAGEPFEPLSALDAFFVEPVPGKEGYKVHVEWLSSFRWRGGNRAELGGEGLLVTRQPEGWVVEVVMNWIT